MSLVKICFYQSTVVLVTFIKDLEFLTFPGLEIKALIYPLVWLKGAPGLILCPTIT